jgi:hypothetical protein
VKTFGTLMIAALLMTSCAGMMRAWRDQNCNYDGAYAAGMNEARKRKAMNPSFAEQCDLLSQEDTQRGYREGYTAGAGGPAIIAGPVAQNAAGPGSPGWDCIEAYGKKECGYACIEAYGNLACGKNPGDNCVEAYGKIRCGRNCREEYGKINCD